MAAEVKAALVNEFPYLGVAAKNGVVVVKIELPLSQQKKATNAIKKIAENIDGVKEVSIYVTPLIGVD